MKFIGSLATGWPVYVSMAMCSVVLVMSGWLIHVSIRMADEMKGYAAQGKCGAEGEVGVEKKVTLGWVVVGLNVLFSVGYGLGFIYWSIKVMRKEKAAEAELMKQKEATQEAEMKSMRKSFAVANASHEIRTSLTGISGLIQMCRAQAVPASPLDHNLTHMESCTNDLYSLLNSILDASKIEAGKMGIEEEEFDLQEVLEDVVDLYYPVGMKKGVEVILDGCDGSVEKCRKVRGDRGKLKQVITNLVYNAIKFTEEGYVSVRAWATDINTNANDIEDDDNEIQQEADGDEKMRREYIFEVVDNGKGIPKEKRNSVFENYVQVKEAGGGNQHLLGHGLGLGIVKSLVVLLGGEIGIVDKQFGEKGTCFRFNTFLESRSGGESQSNAPPAKQGEEEEEDKRPSSRVVLFLRCEERSRIAKRFLESHAGIKVSVVTKGYQQLSRKLTKIKQKLFSQSNTTSGSGGTSPSSRSKVEEGRDQPEERSNWKSNIMHRVLIIIDTSVGSFPEVSGAVAEFLRGLQDGCARVLWIHTTLSINNNLQDEKLNLPPNHLLMSKPLQASRLHYVLSLLLAGFASTSQQDSREVQVVIGDKEGGKEEKQKDEDVVGGSGSGSLQNKPLSGKRMLIVEDNMLLRKLCTTMLSKLGALTQTCNNGEEALKLVSEALRNHHQSPFDYILMDCEMPMMNGFEATKRIKEEGKAMGIWIPIIALTAHTGKEEIHKINEAGMDYYLEKPLQPLNLLTAIQHLDGSGGHIINYI